MEIYIQPHSTGWRPGLRMSREIDDEELRDELLSKFAKKIAKIYAEEVVNAINSQRYKSRWEPLSEPYLKYKRENNLSENIWEATSLAKESIGVWKRGEYYVVGIKRNVKYPGSNIPAYRIIRMIEFGTTKMPARPLFMPVKRLINSRLRRYWDEFIEEEMEYIEDIDDWGLI